jgi:hypothetical protein
MGEVSTKPTGHGSRDSTVGAGARRGPEDRLGEHRERPDIRRIRLSDGFAPELEAVCMCVT